MQSVSASRKLLSKEEKIVLLFDLHVENTLTWDMPSSSSSSHSPIKRFEVIIQGLETFVRRKANFPNLHKFALVVFNSSRLEDMKLIQDFTSDSSEMINSLTNLRHLFAPGMDKNENGNEDEVDISEMLDNLTVIFDPRKQALMEDDFITRCILIYGRSTLVPKISREVELIKDPKFYVDILYIHLKPTVNDESLQCQDAYDALAQTQVFMNEAGKISYVFETFHSMMRLIAYCGMLTAHPAQRCDQEELMVKVDISDRCIQEMKDSLLK